MGGWGDGESTLVRRNTTVERSGEPVHAKRAAQGGMGGWGDGGTRRGGRGGRGGRGSS